MCLMGGEYRSQEFRSQARKEYRSLRSLADTTKLMVNFAVTKTLKGSCAKRLK